MNIVKTLDQYDENCVYFCEPIKNNIICDGSFVRIMYSNSLFTLNGIYLLLEICYTSVEKYNNKVKFLFDVFKHKTIIDRIYDIETTLLKRAAAYYGHTKIPQYKISNQLNNGYIKLFTTRDDSQSIRQTNKFVLKMAGIWETDNEYGLTYKFLC